MKIATLRMLLKPDKLSSFTTSYRPISLISSIMKLFERVIEQRLRSHLEKVGFLNEHQSGFRRAKSTDDLFRLSQSIMESFNRREHEVAAFLDVEKVFNNVWHNGLTHKIFQLDLPRWLSDLLVGRVIQVNVNGFLSNQINPKAGVLQGSVLSPLLFLISEESMVRLKWFLTHFSVIHEDKATIKVKSVFDSAAKFKGRSLNNMMHAGPKLQNNLVDILIHFRFEPVALVGDICEMFLQVGLAEKDRLRHSLVQF